MKIWHRISFGSEHEKLLQQLQIEYERSYNHDDTYSSVVFSIHEQDPAWPTIERIVKAEDTFNFPYTSFEDGEILAAEWIRLCPGFERYYPQPERDMKWRYETFRRRCHSCGS